MLLTSRTKKSKVTPSSLPPNNTNSTSSSLDSKVFAETSRKHDALTTTATIAEISTERNSAQSAPTRRRPRTCECLSVPTSVQTEFEQTSRTITTSSPVTSITQSIEEAVPTIPTPEPRTRTTSMGRPPATLIEVKGNANVLSKTGSVTLPHSDDDADHDDDLYDENCSLSTTISVGNPPKQQQQQQQQSKASSSKETIASKSPPSAPPQRVDLWNDLQDISSASSITSFTSSSSLQSSSSSSADNPTKTTTASCQPPQKVTIHLVNDPDIPEPSRKDGTSTNRSTTTGMDTSTIASTDIKKNRPSDNGIPSVDSDSGLDDNNDVPTTFPLLASDHAKKSVLVSCLRTPRFTKCQPSTSDSLNAASDIRKNNKQNDLPSTGQRIRGVWNPSVTIIPYPPSDSDDHFEQATPSIIQNNNAQNSNAECGFDQLPNDVLSKHILSNLSMLDLCRVSMVSRRFRYLTVQDPLEASNLWKHVDATEFVHETHQHFEKILDRQQTVAKQPNKKTKSLATKRTCQALEQMLHCTTIEQSLESLTIQNIGHRLSANWFLPNLTTTLRELTLSKFEDLTDTHVNVFLLVGDAPSSIAPKKQVKRPLSIPSFPGASTNSTTAFSTDPPEDDLVLPVPSLKQQQQPPPQRISCMLTRLVLEDCKQLTNSCLQFISMRKCTQQLKELRLAGNSGMTDIRSLQQLFGHTVRVMQDQQEMNNGPTLLFKSSSSSGPFAFKSSTAAAPPATLPSLSAMFAPPPAPSLQPMLTMSAPKRTPLSSLFPSLGAPTTSTGTAATPIETNKTTKPTSFPRTQASETPSTNTVPGVEGGAAAKPSSSSYHPLAALPSSPTKGSGAKALTSLFAPPGTSPKFENTTDAGRILPFDYAAAKTTVSDVSIPSLSSSLAGLSSLFSSPSPKAAPLPKPTTTTTTCARPPQRRFGMLTELDLSRTNVSRVSLRSCLKEVDAKLVLLEN